jgi:hypothetical protein
MDQIEKVLKGIFFLIICYFLSAGVLWLLGQIASRL